MDLLEVAQVETLGQLEVQLNRCTLVRTAQSVFDCDVDLRSVKCSVARIQRPRMTTAVERFFELTFGIVPRLDVAQIVLLGSGAQLKFETEVEDFRVDTIEEFQTATNLFHNLVLTAENVSIILLEASNSSQSSQRATRFVAMQNTKVGKTDRQLIVGTRLVIEHQAMTGTVHRLQSEFLLLNFEPKQI